MVSKKNLFTFLRIWDVPNSWNRKRDLHLRSNRFLYTLLSHSDPFLWSRLRLLKPFTKCHFRVWSRLSFPVSNFGTLGIPPQREFQRCLSSHSKSWSTLDEAYFSKLILIDPLLSINFDYVRIYSMQWLAELYNIPLFLTWFTTSKADPYFQWSSYWK